MQPFSRTIWEHPDEPGAVQVIDQRVLPHVTAIVTLRSLEDAAEAIRNMTVRGAPLIGVTAAYGMYLASLDAHFDPQSAAGYLISTRPTAVNLRYAVEQQLLILKEYPSSSHHLLLNAREIARADIESCATIGRFGVELISQISARKNGAVVNILTHCNAGWLACVQHGTATSPIYHAFERQIPIHVWVDETRPRNQGAGLTAWELAQRGVPHTVIADNTGGHLMQHGQVDMVIVGSDRTTRTGDVANKIGTYLKALAAADNGIPFYVALPSTTLDFDISDGLQQISIEERSPEEVTWIQGWDGEKLKRVRLTPEGSPVLNIGFDVTPARLVTALITERGICAATEEGIRELFPEKFV